MLIGITNENEFYSQHFLDEQLETTIAETVREGNKKAAETKKESNGYRTPWALLNGRARSFISAIEEAASLAGIKAIKAERKVIGDMLSLLGLPFKPAEKTLETEVRLPLLGETKTESGAPYLWILHATPLGGFEGEEERADNGTDPLELCISPEQFDIQLELTGKAKDSQGRNWFHILDREVFSSDNSPRWVLLCSPYQWILIDRAKLSQRRVLRFDWDEILRRREANVLQAAAIILGAEAFQQKEGQCYLEILDEGSYKHAHSVSGDLKYALRESIELLGNEAARQLRQKAAQSKTGFFSGKNSLRAEELSDECLRYMYRLLFLFFVESRPELKYAPVEDEAYLAGYSLESLRDLELIPLMSETERNGSYLHESIDRLFRFFEEGTPRGEKDLLNQSTQNAFTIERLPSSLFDPNKLKLLRNVVFPNYILQRVIELMSLSRPTNGKKGQSRGRISYAHLGLNQLGAVYEALLSYRGFFADETLYEVKKADVKEVDPLDTAYFVKEADLDEYAEDEKVFDKDPITGDKVLRRYEKGTFIYRMAGSARENSASYYTPEVLTKCLVEEALDVLVKQQLDGLKDDETKAKKILSWRICEPAMGSAAFLNEAVNQVAELYMRHAMKVPGAEPLTQEHYREELQRVKMFIADRNIYGVDLNPVAVELGEVSLWLNALSDDKYVPWFGLQLHCGNSLIGCRRQAYWRKDLEKYFGSKKTSLPTPHDVGPKGLQPGEIWHFLVPESGMSDYSDRDVKALEGNALNTIKKWNKEFNKPFNQAELIQLEIISVQIESLWQNWAQKLEELDEATSDSYSIYGHEERSKKKVPYEDKMRQMEAARKGDGSLNSGEFMRLKQAFDYWCALWFWPIREADLLPTREEFYRQILAIINMPQARTVRPVVTDLWAAADYAEQEKAEQLKGGVSYAWDKRLKELEDQFAQIPIVNQIAEREKFLHWPLRFANLFLLVNNNHSGFDLTLGNPPWKVASWNSGAVLADENPKYVIHDKKYSAKRIQDVVLGKTELIEGKNFFDLHPKAYQSWIEQYERKAGAQNFFNCSQLYPELIGARSDLFKVFIPTVWRNSVPQGVQGLIHPDTVFTETNGIAIRKAIYNRLKKHYQFANELKLFADIGNVNDFSLNVYGKKTNSICFEAINNLFTPKTIAESRTAPEGRLIEGKKLADGKWNTRGDKDRIIIFNNEKLKTVASIFASNPEAPMLPSLHTSSFLNILQSFSTQSQRLDDLNDRLTISCCWNETTAKTDGVIQELADNVTVFPKAINEAILNGPHLYVGTPLFKCPETPCLSHKAWLILDLTTIPDDYFPRVKYLPNVNREEYVKHMPKVAWAPDLYDKKTGKLIKAGIPIEHYYRVALREMVPLDTERTLTSGIIPPHVCHVNIVESLAFVDTRNLVNIAGYFASLPLDFYVRQQNKGHLLPALLRSIPVPDFRYLEKYLRSRTLGLNCLTTYYKDLWNESFDSEMNKDHWSQDLPQLNQKYFKNLTVKWQRNNALRTDLDRRQALLEIDVIVSIALGLTLNELLTCYRLGFRVMRVYEESTYYDQNGRIIFTSNGNGLRGVGLSRKANSSDGEKYAVNGCVKEKGLGFEDVKDMKTGTVQRTFMDDTLPGGPKEKTIEYVAPFFKMDREKDYEVAWNYFSKFLDKKEDN